MKPANSLKTSHYTTIHDKDGNLINIDKTVPKWLLWYEVWRSGYCNSHRKERLWVDFRAGKLNPFVLSYALVIKIRQGVQKWHR